MRGLTHLSVSNYFHAGSGPLEHLLRLWDVFVGWGFHLSIIVGVARLVNARNQIMNERCAFFSCVANSVVYPNAGRIVTST